ncbi:hypothetical protein JRO89_XS07G0098000 [Xanthoceras sorbifolium]|uniref:Amino acid transporter transmembrane domain-containing protein n=1 Tax=Xanthoceras sorbifolium TaxID=99658 RepID=A0ABQ8HT86_9ROSI|nr:hypothetical protein JRO89_XS07G0098000 [Xanthoceras sorbifolium]
MDKDMQKNSMYIEQDPEVSYQNGDVNKNFDDDGRVKRTGTWITASAHIMTAVIGSGVLSLAWAIAQLGWVAGPAVLMAFLFITYFTSSMLADCYRSPDPVTGKRNYTYMDVVRANLGGRKVQLCGLAQYGNLIGVTIGYTITASITVMSFAYSSIGLGLSIAKIAGGVHTKTSLTGTTVGVDVTAAEKVWKAFQAIGDIAFAYAYSTDTLKSSPPENKSMKRATAIGVSTATLFYILCGCLGYLAFGNDAPRNFLTDFGFYEPFWLINIANVCIAIHLIGEYQVGVEDSICYPDGRISYDLSILQ